MHTWTVLIHSSLALLVWLVVACSGARPAAAPPAGGQEPTLSLPDAAAREGKVVVYSTTDSASAQPLLQDFGALYPAVQVEYNDLNSTELYNRFTSEAAAGAATADFLWSSAMDLQVKLVSDGQALTYRSPEAGGLPQGSVWQDQAYGTTLEPFVFAYNRRLLAADLVPQSHADLVRLLRDHPDLLREKVTTYDPEQSGLGYLADVTDLKQDPSWWELARALGANQVKLYTSTGTMVERITSGEHILGYDIIGSYVLPRSKRDPNLAMVMPTDYTVAFSRVAFIAKTAPHPNAAKLFLDYLISKRGQEVMAQQSLLHALRTDAQGEATAAALTQQLGATLRPIRVEPALLDTLDASKRAEFFRQWKASLQG